MKRSFERSRSREPGLWARLAAGAAVCGVALAACGGSSTTLVSSKQHPKAGKLVDTNVPASVRAKEKAVHSQVTADLHAPVPAGIKPGLPKYLRGKNAPYNRTLTATVAHPKLAIAGDSLVLDLSTGRALATLQGPLYNNKYVGTNLHEIPAKFTFTFTHVRGTLPLEPADFTIYDQNGNRILPFIRVKGGGAMPKELEAGQQLTLTMSTIISSGDGAIIYNPTGFVKAGHKPMAGWDFIVEDD